MLKKHIKNNPKLKQWLWFVALWCFGLSCSLIVAYPIKLLIRNI